MAKKRTFTPKQGHDPASIQLGAKNVTVTAEKPYETSDPAEIAALEAWGAVKDDTSSSKQEKE